MRCRCALGRLCRSQAVWRVSKPQGQWADEVGATVGRCDLAKSRRFFVPPAGWLLRRLRPAAGEIGTRRPIAKFGKNFNFVDKESPLPGVALASCSQFGAGRSSSLARWAHN